MTPSDVKKSEAYMTSKQKMRHVNWNETDIQFAISSAIRKQRMEEFHNDLRDYWRELGFVKWPKLINGY